MRAIKTPLNFMPVEYEALHVVPLADGFAFQQFYEMAPFLLCKDGDIVRATSKYNSGGWNICSIDGDVETVKKLVADFLPKIKITQTVKDFANLLEAHIETRHPIPGSDIKIVFDNSDYVIGLAMETAVKPYIDIQLHMEHCGFDVAEMEVSGCKYGDENCPMVNSSVVRAMSDRIHRLEEAMGKALKK